MFKAHLFLVVLNHERTWRKTVATINTIQEKIRKYRGPKAIRKLAYVNGRYYWDMYGEGWPSEGFKRNVRRECKRLASKASEHVGMRNVLFGITTKCPLQCEHCYEWDNLNIKERLSYSDIETIIEKLIDYGVGQIHFGGGEPMMRFNEMIKLLQKYSSRTGFWIVTSGYNVTEERARTLRDAGLTGMCVSLDHHDEQKHNQFRQHSSAFSMAQQAVDAANKAGIVTALSLCSTLEFTTQGNLLTYAELAKRWGVSFIQILEPRAVGHYAGKSVQLSEEKKKLLSDFFLMLSNDKAYERYPIPIYHEYYKQTLGCRGAGNGALYIDPLGNVHACPFCRNRVGNLTEHSVEECVTRLMHGGCAVPSIMLEQEKSEEVLLVE